MNNSSESVIIQRQSIITVYALLAWSMLMVREPWMFALACCTSESAANSLRSYLRITELECGSDVVGRRREGEHRWREHERLAACCGLAHFLPLGGVLASCSHTSSRILDGVLRDQANNYVDIDKSTQNNGFVRMLSRSTRLSPRLQHSRQHAQIQGTRRRA